MKSEVSIGIMKVKSNRKLPSAVRLTAIILLLSGAILLCDRLYRFALWVSYQQMTNGLWGNGFSCEVPLPDCASAEEVVRGYAKINRAKSFHVYEIRRIWMLGTTQPFWAARVDQDSQALTLLIHYAPEHGQWLVKLE